MKKFTWNYFSILLISLLLLPVSLLTAQIDLELSLTQTVQNPDAWAKYSITATLTNTGSEQAQGIEVAIANPAGTVYQGGNEYTATAGTFNPYNTNQGWLIPTLNPNSVATLTLNLFSLADDIAPVYSQVISASPQDVDSTPNNGVAPIVAEDDEANSTGGSPPTQNRPDLQLTDIQIANGANPGSTVSYTLDLVNAGNATANGDYVIKVYLSASAGQIAGATQVGEINTGNTGVGTINDVIGAISIPTSYPAGNGFVVFYVDAEGDIVESNENNNIESLAFEVQDDEVPNEDFCGFEKEFFDMPAFIFNPRPTLTQVAQEEDGNYSFKVRNGNGQVGFNTVDLLMDAQGNQLSIDENGGPFPNTENQLSSGGSFEASVSGTSDINVLVRAANGNIIFDKNYSNLANGNRIDFEDPKVVEKSGGYYIFGSWIADASPNNTYLYLAELDASGNLLGFNEELYPETVATLKINAITVFPSGELILSIESVSSKEISLARMDMQGASWTELIVGDLVSNRVPSVQYSPSENSVYVLLFFANEQYVRKVNATNGVTQWTTKLSDEFNPNSNSIRTYNLATNMVITEDGGVATGYVFRGPFDDDFQTEIGKLDSDGNAVWWRQFDWADVNLLAAMFETSDGGVVFAGRTTDNYVVYKLNGSGQPTPLCNTTPTGDNIDLELTYSVDNPNPSIWSYFTTTLSISNTGSLPATNVVVGISQPEGVVYRGGDEYSSTQGTLDLYGNGDWKVGALAPGATALLQINYFLKTNASVEFYAEVMAANEEDADSTPANGTQGEVNEDDEAVLTINQQSGSQQRITNTDNAQFRPYALSTIFPNPALHGELNFVLNSKEAAEPIIQVYNSQGQLVKQERMTTTKGINQIRISIDRLSSGMYYLLIQDGAAKAASGKFFVEKE